MAPSEISARLAPATEPAAGRRTVRLAVLAVAVVTLARAATLVAPSLSPTARSLLRIAPASAVGIVCLAFGLMLRATPGWQPAPALRRLLTSMLSAVPAAIGAVIVCEAVTGLTFVSDRYFAAEPGPLGERALPVVTAIVLVLLSLRLGIAKAEWQRSLWSRALTILVAATAQFSFVAVFYRSVGLAGQPPFRIVSPAAALASGLLAAGMLLEEPLSPLRKALTSHSLGGRAARLLLPATTLLPLVTGVLFLLALSRDLVEVGVGVALVSTVTTVGLALLVGRGSAELERSDQARERALSRLGKTLAETQTALGRAEAYFEGAPGAMLAVDSGGIVRAANGQAHALLEHDGPTLVGLSLAELLPAPAGGQGGAHGPSLLAALRSPDGAAQRLSALRRDGSEISLDVHLSTFHATDGLVTLVAFTDVTFQEEVFANLKDLQLRLATTLQSVADGIITADPKLTVTFVNAAAEHLLGITADEAIGRPLESVIEVASGRESLPIRLLGEAVIETGDPFHSGKPLRLRSPAPDCFVECRFTAIRREHGSVAGLVVNLTDRTEAVRTAERERLAEEQRREHQRLESLGLLAAGVAHDFNNLLASVSANAWLAGERAQHDPLLAEYVQHIETAAKRGAELCSQMLTFGSRSRPERLSVQVSDLIDETLALLKVTLSKHVRMRIEVLPDLPPMLANPTQVRQILLNLVLNAAEALAGREGTITLRCCAVSHDVGAPNDGGQIGSSPPARQLLRLEVEDDGPGMDASTQARIFEPFFSTKVVGRGLGLAVVRGIVEAHGATITVRSELGRGTTFTLHWPVAEPGTRASQLRAPVPIGPKDPGPILYAEDDEALRIAQSRVLRELGFEVYAVGSGREAVNAVASEPARFKLALLDRVMGDLDGFATAARLSEIAPLLPIVIVSGITQEEMPVNAQGHPLVVLKKPCEAKVLDETIRSLIQAAK